MDTQQYKILSGDLFLRCFFKLFQIVKIHQPDNPMLVNSVSEFIVAVTRACAEMDKVDLQIYRGRFYFQGERLVYRASMSTFIQDMLNYLKKRGVNGLRFHISIKAVPILQIVDFIELLNNAEHVDKPSEWLLNQLQQKNYSWAEILSEADTHMTVHSPGLAGMARITYSHALTTMKTMAEKIISQKRVGVKKAKRVIQEMVEILVEDDTILLGMSTIRDYDDYTYTHSVNVALLSMCLGKRLGLSRLTLERLGLCGLFHDLGKIEIPIEIINKPEKLSDEEFDQIKMHSINSVRQIIKLNADHFLKARILLPPFEHHLGYDLTGYPQTDRKVPVSLLGKILTVTDNYDAMTSARIYRPVAMSPDRVLQIMIDKSGTHFDPCILKVFINMLGVYPIGTLLLLDTREMCLVKDTPETAEFARPTAILLHYESGGGFRKGKRVNLAERDPESGTFLRNIVKCLHPSDYGIQPSDYLV